MTTSIRRWLRDGEAIAPRTIEAAQSGVITVYGAFEKVGLLTIAGFHILHPAR
jgi:hypothetical protein